MWRSYPMFISSFPPFPLSHNSQLILRLFLNQRNPRQSIYLRMTLAMQASIMVDIARPFCPGYAYYWNFRMQLHHYTSIETLASILDSKRIRFNRIDRVNDLYEAQEVKGIHFGKYFFVSCWTDLGEECIPLWNMYTTKMRGVRISMPTYPFRKTATQAPKDHPLFAKSEGCMQSPIPFDEFWTDDYLILPAFMDDNNFGSNVIYIKDPRALYGDAVDITHNRDGSVAIRISNLFDLARSKREVWAFEHEYRFVLFIMPSPPRPNTPEMVNGFWKQFPNHVISCLRSGIGPRLVSFDVGLAEEVLDNVEVTLGPRCTPGDKLIVEALLAKYTERGSVKESILKGAIR